MPAEPVQDGSRVTEELRRQLTRKTAEVAAPASLPQVSEWRAKAAEYDALMATKTMHAVRIPRAIYGRILARRTQN
jgi:hypothetical protein